MKSFLLVILATISIGLLAGCTDNSQEVVEPTPLQQANETLPTGNNTVAPNGTHEVNVTSPNSGTGHQQNFQNPGMGNAAKMISPAL